VASTKSKSAVTADQIPHIFDDACIEDLASIGKLPPQANRPRFAVGVREAARIYTTEIREPNDNEARAEIEKLHRAAKRRDFEELATLLLKLSSRVRSLLKYDEWTRVKLSAVDRYLSRSRHRMSGQQRSVTLPSPEALRDEHRRDEACARVVKLCQYGGRWIEGRKRPSGKRSATWRPYLRAPKPQRHFPKREAELTFVIWLRIAWVEATGKEAPRTTDPRRPGPFARMVKECLRLVGAAHADAVGLLNKLNQVHHEMTRRPTVPPLSPNNS
jgi:hypothetical protein